MKADFCSSPVATADFPKFADILSAALSTASSFIGWEPPRRPLPQPHLDVWDAVQVQGAQDVEDAAALVILGKTWCVDGGPYLVYNLPKRALEGRGSRGWSTSLAYCSKPKLCFDSS